jgi:hypothetical protein
MQNLSMDEYDWIKVQLKDHILNREIIDAVT